MNIFEESCRKKLRFKTRRGNLTIEDLLDLSIQSLDRVGQTIKEDIRLQADSLIDTSNDEQSINETKLEIVKKIISEKQNKRGVPIKENNLNDEEIL